MSNVRTSVKKKKKNLKDGAVEFRFSSARSNQKLLISSDSNFRCLDWDLNLLPSWHETGTSLLELTVWCVSLVILIYTSDRLFAQFSLFSASNRPQRLRDPSSFLFTGCFEYFTGGKTAEAMKLTTHRHPLISLRITGAVFLLPP